MRERLRLSGAGYRLSVDGWPLPRAAALWARFPATLELIVELTVTDALMAHRNGRDRSAILAFAVDAAAQDAQVGNGPATTVAPVQVHRKVIHG
jgi:hypothetical protein